MSELTPQEIAASFNATNVVVTVDENEPNKFTFFQAGPRTEFVGNTNGTVDIGGVREPRSYLFTWVTAFGEESMPSRPSESVFCRTGEPVIVRGLPNEYVSPDGKPRLVRGIRLYRSIATPGGAEYFRIATLWFPNVIIEASQEDTEVTATTEYPHTLVVGDRISVPNGVFASTPAEVMRVLNRFQFVYRRDVSQNILPTNRNDLLYYDVSEDPTDDEPFYWGLPNGDLGPYEFRDDFDPLALTRILPSLNYEPPPENLQGLTILPSNIVAGFVGSNLYLSEPGQYHAWPSENILSFEHQIVGLIVNAGTLVVLTDGYPYRVDGTTPESMQANKVESMYPCLSKKSIVGMGIGVVYATHSGLALYSPSQGADRVTRFVLDRQDWIERFDPALIKGFEYEDKYVAASPLASFTFERDEQVGGVFVKLTQANGLAFNPAGGWTDPGSGDLYMVDTQVTGLSTQVQFSETIPFTGPGFSQTDGTMRYAPAANQYVVGTGTGLAIYSASTKTLINSFETGFTVNRLGAISPNGRYVVRGPSEPFSGSVNSVVDTVTGQAVLTSGDGVVFNTFSSAFSPDGTMFFSSGNVWAVPSFTLLAQFPSIGNGQAVFSADSRFLIYRLFESGSPFTPWTVRRTDTWEIVQTLDVPSAASIVSRSPSGSVIGFLDTGNLSLSPPRLFLVGGDSFQQLSLSPIEYSANYFGGRAQIMFFGEDRFVHVSAQLSEGHRIINLETGQVTQPANATSFVGLDVANISDEEMLIAYHASQAAVVRTFPFTTGTGINQFDNGRNLSMVWGSKRFRFPSPMDLGAFQVYTDSTGADAVTVTLNSVFRGNADSDVFTLSGTEIQGDICRVPLNGKYDEFSFVIASSIPVKTIRFATSPSELGQV